MTVEAATEISICQSIKNDGGKVLFVRRKTWRLSGLFSRLLRGEKMFRFGVEPDELYVFCEILRALQGCGVTARQAILTLYEESENPWFAKRLGIVLDRISVGDSLSAAMEDKRCRLDEVLGALAVMCRIRAMRMLRRALHVGALGVAVLTVWGLGVVLGVSMFKVQMLLARLQL